MGGSRLDLPGVDYLMVFGAISVLVTCFAVVGIANAFNLIDGYSGLAGMVAVILVGLAYVADQVGDRAVMITAFAATWGDSGVSCLELPSGFDFLENGGAYLIEFLVAKLAVLLVWLLEIRRFHFGFRSYSILSNF